MGQNNRLMNFFYNILDSILLEFADFSAFHFERPKVLWLVLLPILFLLFELFPARKTLDNTNKLRKFIDEHLIKHITNPFSTQKNYSRNLYFCLFFMLCITAIANPRWNYKEEEVFKPNVNLVLLLDVSKSMNVEDEKPNRIERAKQEIEDIIKSTEGASIGLIAFADNQHIIAPITDDKNALKYFLSAIDKSLFNERGSRIDKGIDAAARMLKQYKDGDNFIVILSDGGFESKKSYEDLLNENQNTNIIGIGFGGAQGAGIPDEQGGWIKDEMGKMVISKLDDVEFKKIVSNENYVKASYLDDDTKKIIDLIKNKTNHNNNKQKTDRVWNDRFYIPLIFAMLIFLFKFRKSAAFPVVLIILCLPNASFAADKKPTSAINIENIKHEILQKFSKYFKNEDQQAAENFNANNYGEAATNFKSPYNKGLAEFKGGNLQQSAADFDSYIANIQNDKNANNLKADALYNKANAQIFMPDVEASIKTYEQALSLNPNHTLAKHNLEIAKKILEQKKKQEEQQKQQQEKNNKNNKNKKDKNKNSDDKKESDSQDQNKDENKNDNSQQNSNDKNNQQSQSENNKGDKKPDSENQPDEQNKQNGEEDKDKSNQPPSTQNESSNKENGKENKNDKNNAKSSQQRKTSLDTNAEEMMNRLKNDPSELLKRRFQMNKNQDNENTSGGNRPW
jgi:Ca-activated chloride channel family protein